MEFTSYPLWLSQPDCKAAGGTGRLVDRYENVLEETARACAQASDDGDANQRQGKLEVLLMEHRWLTLNRPFYHVYPAVVECLLRTKLDFSLSQLDISVEPTALCFAVGREPRMGDYKLKACIVTLDRDTLDLGTGKLTGRPTLAIACDRVRDGYKPGWTLIRRTSNGGLLSDGCDEIPDDKMAVIRLAVGVAMLATDEKYCEPLLLQRDERRGLTGEARQAAVERARRRGVVGFAIGKDIEKSPHIRRPHFGIRWTEKGRTVPKLVPISGSVISKKLLYPIPTGKSGPVD